MTDTNDRARYNAVNTIRRAVETHEQELTELVGHLRRLTEQDDIYADTLPTFANLADARHALQDAKRTLGAVLDKLGARA